MAQTVASGDEPTPEPTGGGSTASGGSDFQREAGNITAGQGNQQQEEEENDFLHFATGESDDFLLDAPVNIDFDFTINEDLETRFLNPQGSSIWGSAPPNAIGTFWGDGAIAPDQMAAWMDDNQMRTFDFGGRYGITGGSLTTQASSAANLISTYLDGSDDGYQWRANIQQLIKGAFGYDDDPLGGFGSPLDTKYEKAFRDAVMISAQTQIPLIPLLRQMGERNAASGRGGGGGSGARQPTIQVISDEDARMLIERVAQSEIGRDLTDDENAVANAIIREMQSGQRGSQQAMIAQQNAGGGGEVQQQISPQTTATTEVRNRFETEYDAHSIAQNFMDFIRTARG